MCFWLVGFFVFGVRVLLICCILWCFTGAYFGLGFYGVNCESGV